MMKRLLATVLVAGFALQLHAQKHPVEKTWYNAEKTSRIRIFKATDGKFYGKIVWLKTPNDTNGQPRTDKENPDESRRSKPLMDLIILSGFSASSDPQVLEGGKVYDPNNGKTYCGKLTLKGDVLDLRGYICGMSFLGRTAQWTLAE
ncbi:MAG: DUF2147 domain-containing protein [Chitinophagaceae bacterium]|jgi:uncharacterized protein (DUF2147 family)|nr:DUF2147 domain-containing protein [Chitinophagaceae bacterium]